jgi:hypothetical protein
VTDQALEGILFHSVHPIVSSLAPYVRHQHRLPFGSRK